MAPRCTDEVAHLLTQEPSTLRTSGFANLVRKVPFAQKILVPRWILAGTPLEPVTDVMERGNQITSTIRQHIWEHLNPIRKWSPETKATVSRLSYVHASDSHAAFEQAVRAEAPEAVNDIGLLRNTMERMWLRLVEDGVIRPGQRFNNYLPVVRETMEAVSRRELQIEAGEGFIPKPLLDVIASYDPQFAKSRVITDIDAFPTRVSFDDRLWLYLSQFARHVATREVIPEVNRLLSQAPPHLTEYTSRIVNHWLGRTGVQPLGEFTHFMRAYNFARTIGGSIMSPLVNTMQRLNTFALVRPSSFMQAFDDRFDPTRMAMLSETGLEALAKGGIDEAPINTETLTGLAMKIGRTSGKLFSISEKGNRIHAFLAGLREAEARGIVEPAAQRAFAQKLVNDTQFIQTSANIPLAFQSDWGKLAGQFQTFRLNQLHFMARLLDDAQQGAREGDFSRLMPAVKFFGAGVAIGGGGTVTFGDTGEEKATRALLGRAVHIPGFTEHLFGVSLASQLGMGAVGFDDINSFLFYFPGPTFTFLQALLGVATGVNFGQGLSNLDRAGAEIPFDQRTRMLVSLMPTGIQLNRLVGSLRLIQNSGEYREGLDLSEVLPIPPFGNRASGDLLAESAASLEQALLGAAGLPQYERVAERRMMQRRRQMERDKNLAVNKAANYLAAGRTRDAEFILAKFSRKYEDQGLPPLGVGAISDQAYQQALLNKILPPGRRKLPDRLLAGTEPFQGMTPELY